MTVLETIKANPQAVTKGAFGLVFAAVTFWFLVIGKPDQAESINNTINQYVVPVTGLITIALGFLSAMHFSRGPVPVIAAPVVVETVAKARAEGIMPETPPSTTEPKP